MSELAPTLETQIEAIPVIDQPDVTEAFRSFFKGSTSGGPTEAGRKRQANQNYVSEMSKALEIVGSNEVAGKMLAQKAYYNLIAANGGSTSDQAAFFTRVTGSRPEDFGVDTEETAMQKWILDHESTYRAYRVLVLNKLNDGSSGEKTFSEEQINKEAWLLKIRYDTKQAVLAQQEQMAKAGEDIDGNSVISAVADEYVKVFAMFKEALKDNQVSQMERQEIAATVNGYFQTRYAAFLGENGNTEVKNYFKSMKGLVGSLDSFDNPKALLDSVTRVLQKQGVNPVVIAALNKLIDANPERVLEMAGGDLDAMIKVLKSSGNNFTIGFGELKEKVEEEGVDPSTYVKEAPQKSVEECLDYLQEVAFTVDLSKKIEGDPEAAKDFSFHSKACLALVSENPSFILGGKYEENFAGPNFIKNLEALFGVDGEAATKVLRTVEKSVAAQANQILTEIGSLSDKSEGAGKYLTYNQDTGEVFFDFDKLEKDLNKEAENDLETGSVVGQLTQKKLQMFYKIRTIIDDQHGGSFQKYLNSKAFSVEDYSSIDNLLGSRLKPILGLYEKIRVLEGKRKRLVKLADGNPVDIGLFEYKSAQHQNDNIAVSVLPNIPPLVDPREQEAAGKVQEEIDSIVEPAIVFDQVDQASEAASNKTPEDSDLSEENLREAIRGFMPRWLRGAEREAHILKKMESFNVDKDILRTLIKKVLREEDQSTYGTEEKPWPIAWTDEQTEDEKLFNSLDNGDWFIDPDGTKRQKQRDIPVEGN